MAVIRFLVRLVGILLLLGLALGAAGLWWVDQPIVAPGAPLDLVVEPGNSAPAIANKVAAAGAQVAPEVLALWFRVSGKSRQIKAGSYEMEPGISPARLLEKLVNGEQALRSVTLVEGWTFRQVRQALDKLADVRHDSQGQSNAEIMAKLGVSNLHPEGQFFPDTYRFPKNGSDYLILQAALQAMRTQLDQAWKNRLDTGALQSQDELLKLASIVEKETGAEADRGQVAAVFHNRLRIGMRLQTDPTVIYGRGDSVTGSLRKIDLLTDTPYNTYTRAGLPPTPIAMPGKAALWAAARPPESKALYFVAKGDGSSHFSESLQEHNRAVNHYIRGR